MFRLLNFLLRISMKKFGQSSIYIEDALSVEGVFFVKERDFPQKRVKTQIWSGGHFHLWYLGEGFVHLGLGVAEIFQLSRKVGFICRQIEMAVP